MAPSRALARLGPSVVLAASLALVASSCVSWRAAPPASTASPASPNETVARVIVPAGTRFHARLDRPLSSERVRAGDALTARLDEPLRAGDGTIVAPRGATLTGRVLVVERAGVARVTLRFEQLHVNGRAYPIFPTLLRLEAARVVASTDQDPDEFAVDVLPSAWSIAMPPSVGGGPPADEVPVEAPRDAEMSFELSRSFAFPAASTTRELESTGEVDRTFE